MQMRVKHESRVTINRTNFSKQDCSKSMKSTGLKIGMWTHTSKTQGLN